MKPPWNKSAPEAAGLTEQQRDLLSSILRRRDQGLVHIHSQGDATSLAIGRQLVDAFEAAGWVAASDHRIGLGPGIVVQRASSTFSHFLAVVEILTEAKIPFTLDTSSGVSNEGYVEIWVRLQSDEVNS